MIKINLLPPEIKANLRYQQRRLPIIPFLLVIFIVIFLYWVIIILSITHLNVRVAANAAKMKAIAPQKSEVDVIWNEVHNELRVQKKYIDEIIQGPIEWAQILYVVSSEISQGIWLVGCSAEKKDQEWLITIKGLAKPISNRSMIKDVGLYVTQIKKNIESILQKQNTQSKVEVSTVTKRKKAESLELTEFVTTFSIVL